MSGDLSLISDSGGGWNSDGEASTTVYRVEGALRDRVLRRWGLDSGEVTLEEETWYGGTSEYTQENSRTFTVRSGEREIVFYADSDSDDFEPNSIGYGDTVFARFNAWLIAAETPVDQITEWMETVPSEESGIVSRYRLNQGTILWSRLRRHRYGITGAYVQRVGDRTEMCLLREHKNGFVELVERRALGIFEGTSILSVAPALAAEITDRYMPGPAL